MKKQILAACVAALSLAAAGCTEEKTQPAGVSENRVHPAEAARPISPPPPVVATVTPTVQPVPAGVPDGGMGATEVSPAVDLVGLDHEDGRIVDHLARAEMLKEEGDLDGAMAEARRAAFDNPEDTDALAQVERIAKLTGNKKLRVAALDRMASLDKDDATPLIQQARVLIAMKDYEGAIKVATEATSRDETNPESFQAIGRAYLSLGQLTPAIANFKKVIAIDPDHGYALNNLGFALLRANENEEALNVLTHAAEVLPNLAYVHNNLGVALERMGKKDEAKKEYATASDLSPKYVKARVNASRVASVSPKDVGTDTQQDEIMSDGSSGEVDPQEMNLTPDGQDSQPQPEQPVSSDE